MCPWTYTSTVSIRPKVTKETSLQFQFERRVCEFVYLPRATTCFVWIKSRCTASAQSAASSSSAFWISNVVFVCVPEVCKSSARSVFLRYSQGQTIVIHVWCYAWQRVTGVNRMNVCTFNIYLVRTGRLGCNRKPSIVDWKQPQRFLIVF